MKTLRFLCAALTLIGVAACTDASPTNPTTPDAPSFDETSCKAGGYLGSDGKWVCN